LAEPTFKPTWPEVLSGNDLFSSIRKPYVIGYKGNILLICGAITLAVGALDFWTEPYLSLGFLYVFPIILVAAYVPRWLIVLLACVYAGLSEAFSSLPIQFLPVRLIFETLGLAGCGVFAGELIRGRRQQDARLRALVETSTAAIITVNEHGSIELANRGAVELLVPDDGRLVGRPIAAFLPCLHNALWRGEQPQLRASMQCFAHKGNGELFQATVWFSTYQEGGVARLAAIIGNIGGAELAKTPAEEDAPDWKSPEPQPSVNLSDREAAVLQLVVQGLANKEIAVRIDVSESTVKHTIQQLFAKTGVRTRGQLVRIALDRYPSLL